MARHLHGSAEGFKLTADSFQGEKLMRNVGRKLAFVLAASNHGTMIVNRLDGHAGAGVGHRILEAGSGEPVEVELALQLLELRRRFHGDGVVGIDCGAHVGAQAVEWATAMTGWGSVVAIEAQERLYYALAGNIAINNCFNAIAMHAAVAAETGIMQIPQPDYLTPANFGALALRPREDTAFIGQALDYSDAGTVAVQKIALDTLALPRVDLIKLDVAGMEREALDGATQTIARSHPVLLAAAGEATREPLRALLAERGYHVVEAGLSLLAIHKSDPTLTQLKIEEAQPQTNAA
jgi:FkbM family methyltransferase